nr:MFS multidrug transporter [Colletotrichum truncatum]KAF6800737.1 MFS multidrug transporter [Colletotrichum truncatum]
METEPLLQDGNSLSDVSEQDIPNGHSVGSKNIRSFFLCIFALELCVKFAVTLLELPMIGLVELMVCQRYPNVGAQDIHDEACKIPIVQNKLAQIIGYKTTLDALPCLLTVLPYGYISNFRGRRFVILLQISGRLLALCWIVIVGFFSGNPPPQLIWISSLFLFIGGGRKAQVSIVYTSFCDVIPKEERTRLLALAHASEGLAGIMAYPIGSMLMSYRLWAPFALAFIINVFEYVVLWYTPETSPFIATKRAALSVQSPTHYHLLPTIKYLQQALSSCTQRSNLWVLFKHGGLNVIFACFFTKRIAFAAGDFVSQYVSEILHRKIFETFWLQACNHVGMLLALSVLIPFLTHHMKSPAKDLWVISCSLINIVVGFLVLWFGRSVPTLCLGLLVCGLGEGLDVGLQSLGSYIVGVAHHGTFFSLSGMLGVAGELLGGPIMAAAYTPRGKDGEPLGYCFLLSTILFTCMLLGSRFINTAKLLE